MTNQSTTPLLSQIGVLVLVPPGLDLIYMNHEAKAVCEQLARAEAVRSDSRLPGAVQSVVALVTGRHQQSAELLWRRGTPSIRLQAFAIERGVQIDKRLVIVVLERVGAEPLNQQSAMETSALFTAREKQVLNWLKKGYTNKEIAVELQITEQTVKKHVSHILLKSRMPNRVGVLARLIGSVA